MAHMTQSDWDAHINAINEFHDDAFQQTIIWHRSSSSLSSHGEDNNQRAELITLKGLIVYNQFRSWPMNKVESTGEIDSESCLVYLNLKYLGDNNYLNNQGQFAFDPVLDRFEVQGLIYKTDGDSQTAQAKDITLLHFLILKREEIGSHQSKY